MTNALVESIIINQTRPYFQRIKTLFDSALVSYWPLHEAPAGNDYLTFNGTTTNVNCGSGASLDNLAAADLTIDFWFQPATLATVVAKGGYGLAGYLVFAGAADLAGRMYTDGLDSISLSVTDIPAGWHHGTFFWDVSERKIRLAIDGVWSSLSDALAAGSITDAAHTFYIGRRSDTAGWWYSGPLGWVRVSNNDRFSGAAGTNFTAPSRTTIPTVDANTVSLWPMNEGYGTVAGDIGANNNDGTITAGDWAAYPAAKDYSVNARNGTYTGVLLAQVAAPKGGMSPYFDGTNDRVAIPTAGVSLTEGACGLFMKCITARTGWAWDINDGSAHHFSIMTHATSGVGFLAGSWAGNLTRIAAAFHTNWAHYIISWSQSNNRVNFYYNGTKLTGIAYPAGAPTGFWSYLIGYSGEGLSYHLGYVSDCWVLNREITDIEASIAGQ